MKAVIPTCPETPTKAAQTVCHGQQCTGRLGFRRRTACTHGHVACKRIEAGSVPFGGAAMPRESGRAGTICRASGDASVGTSAKLTCSELVQREVVLFLIQLDLDRQLQRALNYDNFEAANEIRARKEQLTEAVEDFQASKGPGDGAKTAARREVADFASEGLRLRSEMQRAAEEERYKDASALRDKLKELQQKSDAAAAAAAAGNDMGGTERQFQLGQRVIHSELRFRGAICGWDTCCCEDEEWQSANCVWDLQRGPQQPFYHVLVDIRDCDDPAPDAAIAYLPEELLVQPETNDTWSDDHGEDASFMHPYAGLLFLGCDHAGDFVPSKALREKYSMPRRDVGPEDDDGGYEFDPDQGPGGNGPSGLDIDGPDGGLTIM